MQKFSSHTGTAVALLADNINTDQIIPSREMKRVSKHGLADGLFANLRYSDAATGGKNPNPEFVLNQPHANGASLLLSGANFGCGSSREHAVWALQEFGFRVIVASSFGSIFFDNCIANGMLPIILDQKNIATLAEHSKTGPLTVDLQQRSITSSSIRCYFNLDSNRQELLLNGLSAIDMTLKLAHEIENFIKNDESLRPWLYPQPEGAAKYRSQIPQPEAVAKRKTND
ncbi:3-isopropylmalate dehydratase small subunit [Chromatiales bacterium (ex Bugula neritina AB1)]|nr:3-isopropylmalate dehydratase small subunit [Chromatiales bacterium (ex Bugula neritina AB1)]